MLISSSKIFVRLETPNALALGQFGSFNSDRSDRWRFPYSRPALLRRAELLRSGEGSWVIAREGRVVIEKKGGDGWATDGMQAGMDRVEGLEEVGRFLRMR